MTMLSVNAITEYNMTVLSEIIILRQKNDTSVRQNDRTQHLDRQNDNLAVGISCFDSQNHAHGFVLWVTCFSTLMVAFRGQR